MTPKSGVLPAHELTGSDVSGVSAVFSRFSQPPALAFPRTCLCLERRFPGQCRSCALNSGDSGGRKVFQQNFDFVARDRL